MAGAVIELFEDIGCTRPLVLSGAAYDMILGPLSGLDGDTGDMAVARIYLKNTGDKGALHIRVTKTNDAMSQIKLSADGIDYVENNCSIEDIAPSAVRELFVQVLVPRGASSSLYTPTFVINYDSPV